MQSLTAVVQPTPEGTVLQGIVRKSVGSRTNIQAITLVGSPIDFPLMQTNVSLVFDRAHRVYSFDVLNFC